MNVTQAAERLNISERSVYRLIADGLLPATVQPRLSITKGYDVPKVEIERVWYMVSAKSRWTVKDIRRELTK